MNTNTKKWLHTTTALKYTSLNERLKPVVTIYLSTSSSHT